MPEKINIEGQEISIKSVDNQDYISLTDMSNWDNSEYSRDRVRNWLKNRSTLNFLAIWEKDNNPEFNYAQMDVIKNQAPENSFSISAKKYIEMTNAKGIISKTGRYGGTFAHVDIAFEFGSWLNAEFKYRLIKEFKRLRSEEVQRNRLQWDASRELSRLNYPLQTQAIKENIVPRLGNKKEISPYASEADLINFLVFGMTAKEWRELNPDAKGNIRDGGTRAQNVVLANLESFNAELIHQGTSREARERALADMAARQLAALNERYLAE